MTEMLMYSVAGIALYFASDWILQKMEQQAGQAFDNRNLVFFVIILFLALVSFTLLRLVLP